MRALLPIVLFAITAIAATPEISPATLVGKWPTEDEFHKRGRFTFKHDMSFSGTKGDMIFAGHWQLLAGSRLKLTYYSDYEKKILGPTAQSTIIGITAASGRRLHVIWS